MRPIKFRAWNKKLKRMRQVLALEMEPKEWPQTSTRIAVHTVFDHPCVHSALIKKKFDKWLETDCELMQFTGLFDRGGKEIYEGDIIQYGIYKGTVEFGNHDEWYAPCFWIKNLNDDYSGKNYKLQRYFKSQNCVEVIGNIYEHPHLMEVE